MQYFSLDLDAHKITFLTGLNCNTVNRYLLLIRKRIVEYCKQSSPFHGEIEVYESYFGAKRVKGKHGRGAYNKTPVFGLLQRGGTVYTEIVPDCARKILQTIIRGKVDLESIIYSDFWRMIGYRVMKRWAKIADKFPRRIKRHVQYTSSLFVEFGVATVTISVMS